MPSPGWELSGLLGGHSARPEVIAHSQSLRASAAIPGMRLGPVVCAAVFGFFLAPRVASAAEAPPIPAVSAPEEAPDPRHPLQQTEDWIAVFGIVCYSALPVIAILTLGFLTYRWIENGRSMLFSGAFADRDAWMWTASARSFARPPPSGFVLARF